MILQSQISRKYGETEYRKSWVVISQDILKKLGWKTGEELKAEVQEGKLVVEKN